MQAYRQHIRENLSLALDTLRTHKFRSFLTILGVLIGTTTVIAVTSIVAGLDKQLVDVAEQFGTRTLWVYKMQLGAPHRLTRDERLRKPLSYEDAMAIKEQSPSTETVSVELFREMGEFGVPPVTARYKGQDMIDALFIGVTADHLGRSQDVVEPDQHVRDEEPALGQVRTVVGKRDGRLQPCGVVVRDVADDRLPAGLRLREVAKARPAANERVTAESSAFD
jgi:hypothetical protein